MYGFRVTGREDSVAWNVDVEEDNEEVVWVALDGHYRFEYSELKMITETLALCSEGNRQ